MKITNEEEYEKAEELMKDIHERINSAKERGEVFEQGDAIHEGCKLIAETAMYLAQNPVVVPQ